MAEPKRHQTFSGGSRLTLFWALSRTPHGLLDMCTPAFAALLWLGHFPPPAVMLMGIVTAFAGYTAVYALNDVVDYRLDREKAAAGALASSAGDIDALIIRHPMAHGLLSFREGLAWASGWALVALLGALSLNPMCVVIFLGGCAFEALYCRLWRISPYRTLVSGAVKTAGPMAAVFAVDPHPSAVFLAALFLMLFCWEIGGQNIPNDLTDLEEDRRLGARTLPVCFGEALAVSVVGGALAAALLLSVIVFLLSPLPHKPTAALLALLGGCYYLLWPGLRLHKDPGRTAAMQLFTWASLYPPALLAVVVLALLAP